MIGKSVKRDNTKLTILFFQNKVVCEVKDAEHGENLRKVLESNFEDVKWFAYHIEHK